MEHAVFEDGDSVPLVFARIVRGRVGIVAAPMMTLHPRATVREMLERILSALLTGTASQTITLFADWDHLVISQCGESVILDAPCLQLDRNSPLICLLRENDPVDAESIVFQLTCWWRNKQREKDAEEFARRLTPHLAANLSLSMVGVPTSQERHWLSGRAVVALKTFFHQASDEIAIRLAANPTRREEGLTSDLVFDVFSNGMRRRILEKLKLISAIDIEFSCEESGSAEAVTGADLGFCITVRGRGLLTRRAILLQAKRLHPTPDEFSSLSYYGDLLEPHGLAQASKMLAITPCSYFMLYNPTGIEDLFHQQAQPLQINNTLDYSTNGICILPASVAQGMDRSVWNEVIKLHPFTCSFVKFMVDDFIQGKVGDSRKDAVAAALTRGLRRASNIDGDVPPPRFAISLTVDVSETIDDTGTSKK